MNARYSFASLSSLATVALGVTLLVPTLHAQQGTGAVLAVDTARVTLAGTSNIHDYTAETTEVRLLRAELAGSAASGGWAEIVAPDALQAFAIAFPAASLRSTKDGLDKNMHKALKVDEFPDVTFTLTRLEAATADEYAVVGTLSLAGVEREVELLATIAPRETTLLVTGQTDLLMTDFGIKPPRAMLGMLRTHPKVTVTFEVALSRPTP